MKRRKSYRDLLSTYIVVFERDGVEFARDSVESEDADSARGDAFGLKSRHGIDIFDETVRTRVERADASRT